MKTMIKSKTCSALTSKVKDIKDIVNTNTKTKELKNLPSKIKSNVINMETFLKKENINIL